MLVSRGDHLRVETLGPLRAYAGDRELALGPPKQRATFAILALRTGKVVSRDELIDGLWGESPPATAVGSLHTYVSGLRRALAVLDDPSLPLTSSDRGYALRLDPARLDIAVVERLAAQARGNRAEQDPAAAVSAYDRALNHWHPGSALSGLPGPLAAEHRVWVSELRLSLLLERAESLLDLGQPMLVADQLRRQVLENPYHERLSALLMTALSRSGRTADALAHYHHLRKRLADDLGIDPSAKLRTLYESMLVDPPSTSAPTASGLVRPAQLPQGVGRFAGRTESVRQVLDAARTPSPGASHIVMIVGVGGVGKTALAVHCGHQLADAYPDGQLYVNLRGFDPKRPASAPADVLHHLLTSIGAGAIPAAEEARVALWRSLARDKRLLIMFDNAESADQLDGLLPGGGPSFTIVTSRNRLGGLAVRHSARRVTLSPFSAGESLELLSDAIGGARVGAEPTAAHRLAELCGHLPLALRIVAEQVSAGPSPRIADLVADLADVWRRLDTLEIPGDELASVRGVLSCSYAKLPTETAHAFRILGLFPGGSIRRETAAALLDVPPSAATNALRSLAAHHLVEATGDRYVMHDLTRIYAEEVSRGGEPAASRRRSLERALRWYVQTLSCHHTADELPLPFTVDAEAVGEEPPRFADQQELVTWCAREWENLGPLVRTAQRIGCHDAAWQLAYLLFDYFHVAGQAGDWAETLRIGLRSAELIGNRRGEAVLLNHLGVAHSRVGQNAAALEQLERGLRLADELGDDVLRTSLLGNLASTLREAEDYPAAFRYAERALALAYRTGSAYHQSGCLDVLCGLHAERGEFAKSLRYGIPGLAAARRCRNALLEANLLINLGLAEHGLGDTEAARRCFQDALSLCSANGDRYHEALALSGLARIPWPEESQRSAEDLADQAREKVAELGAAEAAAVTGLLDSLDAVDAHPASPIRCTALGGVSPLR
ncbi:AfsR/SARP family transcriptional regulator [Streptomyces pinistramenti]|uniref:AfsR/SARP family transcriptional regulator n=1 Tax=Streptomyces pinistramenti TaxID=2884812 RepID=UPI0027E54F2B|nr:BTAD domain-containing putative transcriptional regulator [Streptomyces pinistramenti]